MSYITKTSDTALNCSIGEFTYDIFKVPPTQRPYPCEIGEVIFAAGHIAIETLRFVLKLK